MLHSILPFHFGPLFFFACSPVRRSVGRWLGISGRWRDGGGLQGVNQSSLPGSILSSRNSHTHAGTASNCISQTKQGTGFHVNNITESTVVLEYSHQGDFSDFGTFNCLCIQIYKLLKQPGQVILLKWTCLDHVPLWRMAFPKPVASNHLARCSLEQSLHVYDYLCY